MSSHNMQPRGFVALISIVIIAGVLLTIAASGSLGGFFNRGNVLNDEYKARSSALSDACVDEILLKLHDDPTYTGGDVVSVGSDHCEIKSGASGDPRTFFVQAIYQHAYTNLEVVVDPLTLQTQSKRELKKLP